jgi:hypothetical protein
VLVRSQPRKLLPTRPSLQCTRARCRHIGAKLRMGHTSFLPLPPPPFGAPAAACRSRSWIRRRSVGSGSVVACASVVPTRANSSASPSVASS